MNPFFDICDNSGLELEGSVFGTAFGALNEPAPAKLGDITVTLSVSLKEFYCGSHKDVSYERQVVGLDGRSVKNETSVVEVYIRPGMLETQELVFKCKGNEQPGQVPTNLIIKFKSHHDGESKPYMRQGTNDLIYRHRTTLAEVIQCKPVVLKTLDGRRLLIPVDQVMSPNNVKVVEGEGLVYDCGMKYDATERERMLMARNVGRRGDLYILFDIQFPTQLNRDQKDQVEALLKSEE